MSKYLGTLNVDAGDAGTISLEITTSTPLDRITAVLHFADEMTTGKPDGVVEAEPAIAPDPPLPAKTKTMRRESEPKTPSPGAGEVLECDVCAQQCKGAHGLGRHKRAAHGVVGAQTAAKQAKDADTPTTPAPSTSEFGPDAELHRCNDCDFNAPVTAFGAAISAHARKEHGRQATSREKSPRTQADVDAEEEV